MKYNHKNKSLTISVEDMDRAAMALLAAIHKMTARKPNPFRVGRNRRKDCLIFIM